MGQQYRLRIEASKPKTMQEALIQAELHDLFEHVYKPFGIESEIVNGREYVYWMGEVHLSGGMTEEQYHEKVREFITALIIDFEDKCEDLKVQTFWKYLDDYDKVVGEKV